MRRLFVALLLATSFGPTWAADRVEVTYADTEKFADFGDSNWERERNQADFSAMLQVLAQRLPATQQLRVKVLDVNLAGELDWWRLRGDRIRVLRNVTWPVVEFEYQVLEGGKLVKADTVRVSDMAYLQSSLFHDKGLTAFGYESRMLDRWARETFGK